MEKQFMRQRLTNGLPIGRMAVVGGLTVALVVIVAFAFPPQSASPDRGAARLAATDLRDVFVPERLRGFETLVGSPERGFEVLSQRVECLDCHSLNPGEDNGYPNLADVGRRLAPPQIVSAILEPSRDFADGFRSVAITTVDGRTVQGTIVEHKSSPDVVCVRTCCGEVRLKSDEIEARDEANSAMPEGLVDRLTPQEFADLVELLCRMGRRS